STDWQLLEAIHKIKIAQRAVEAVDVGVAVGRHQDGADGGDAGGIERGDLLPDSSLSSIYFDAVNLGRDLAAAVKENGAAVLTPIDGHVSGFHSIDWTGIATCCGKQIALLV